MTVEAVVRGRSRNARIVIPPECFRHNGDLVIEVRNWIVPIELRLDVEQRGGEPATVKLSLTMYVPHRDTGELTTTRMNEKFRVPFLDHTHAERWVYEALFRSLRHELDEAWHVHGVRVRDPHRDEVPR